MYFLFTNAVCNLVKVIFKPSMKRREFVRNTLLGSTLPFWLQACDWQSKTNSPISVHTDHKTGHLMFESQQWPRKKAESVPLIIAGGGVAGLAAAGKYREENFRLFELSDRFGGTAASQPFQGIDICQGAHYDLDYPEYYGEDVFRLLEQIKAIEYQPWKKSWSFVDRQHLIPSTRRQQCFQYGKIRADVIPEGPQKERFLEIIAPYLGEMKLPTRLINPELKYLDQQAFVEFLAKEMEVDDTFKRYLDYHMMDDYGGTADQVSALAGIHYFMCRPYYREPVSLFSPPMGNDYFVRKMIAQLDATQLLKKHLVSKIEKSGAGFSVEVLNIEKQVAEVYQADRVVYAGQKHALKYVFPEEYELFSNNNYAPWMVVNLITGQQPDQFGYWQNEYLGEDPSFLGFIDSSVQDRGSLNNNRVLTAYYCLKPEDRKVLKTIPENKERIVSQTLERIEEFLGTKLSVKQAFIKVMGHAMPIPEPGYLFQERSKTTALSYAGVDTGRLPLLFDALDSGLQA